MLKIGVTGGIGSGKSTVCRVFEILGIPVFYADQAAKAVMVEDTILRGELQDAFGRDAYTGTGELNRKYISSIVFQDTKKLEQLNAIVHPAVFRAFDAWADRQEGAPYLMKEAALLFESGSYKRCNYNILVTSPEELKIRRIMERDQVSEEEVRLRMSRQFTDEQKAGFADHILLNDEKSLLIPQILSLHRQFLGLSV